MNQTMKDNPFGSGSFPIMLRTFLCSLVAVLALHIKGVPNGTKKTNLDSNLKKREAVIQVFEKQLA